MASVEAPPAPPAAAPEATPAPEPAAALEPPSAEAATSGTEESLADRERSVVPPPPEKSRVRTWVGEKLRSGWEKVKGPIGRSIDRYRSWNERRKTLNADEKVHDAQVAYDEARADEARFKQSADDLVQEIAATEQRMIAMGSPLSDGAKQNMQNGLTELLRLQEDARQRAEALQENLNKVKEAQQAQEAKADAVAARINGPYEARQEGFNRQQEVLEREREALTPRVNLWRGEVKGLEESEQALLIEIKKMKRSPEKYAKMSELSRVQREKQWKASRLSFYERDLASYNYSLGWIDEQVQGLLKKKVPVLGAEAKARAEALKKDRPNVPKRASSTLPWTRTGRRRIAME